MLVYALVEDAMGFYLRAAGFPYRTRCGVDLGAHADTGGVLGVFYDENSVHRAKIWPQVGHRDSKGKKRQIFSSLLTRTAPAFENASKSKK